MTTAFCFRQNREQCDYRPRLSGLKQKVQVFSSLNNKSRIIKQKTHNYSQNRSSKALKDLTLTYVITIYNTVLQRCENWAPELRILRKFAGGVVTKLNAIQIEMHWFVLKSQLMIIMKT